MGHVKEKYTREYFLGAVDQETGSEYGVAGFEAFKRGHLEERYRRFLLFLNLKGKIVLDVGCGRGEVVNYCAGKGAKRVVGIDFSPDAIAIARDHNKNNSNVELLEMEAKDIKFDDVFDIVFMLDVVEHIPDEEMQLIYPKIYLALKKTGILVVNTPMFSSRKDKDQSDFIPAVRGMHCNKQTKEKLNNDLIRSKFRKYSLNVWSKSDQFCLSSFVYARVTQLRDFLLKLHGEIRPS
jgi:2-polyprenyl-3-methyl-5-hydroxy-6-metoxy-1,4-benzoquinol methylase